MQRTACLFCVVTARYRGAGSLISRQGGVHSSSFLYMSHGDLRWLLSSSIDSTWLGCGYCDLPLSAHNDARIFVP